MKQKTILMIKAQNSCMIQTMPHPTSCSFAQNIKRATQHRLSLKKGNKFLTKI